MTDSDCVITKFELASIISKRAGEIAKGEPITIKNPSSTNPIAIALYEFRENRLPKKIVRYSQGGKREIWGLSEMCNIYGDELEDFLDKISN